MFKKLTVLLGMISIFCIVTVINIFQWLTPTVDYPRANGGNVDALGWEFSSQGSIPLRGQWEFYENRLLGPDDFRKAGTGLASERRIVQVPGGWKIDVDFGR